MTVRKYQNFKFKVKVKTYLLDDCVKFLIKKIEIKGDQHVFRLNSGEDIDDASTCSDLISYLKKNHGFEDGDEMIIKHEDYNRL